MVKFRGMTIGGVFCDTAEAAAARAKASTQTIYARQARGWTDGDPTGQGSSTPLKHRDILYRGKPFADIPTACASENVTRQAVHSYLVRSGQIKVTRS